MYISRHILFDEMQTHPSVRTEQPKPYESPFPFPHTIPSSPSPQIGTHAPVPRSPIGLSSQLSPSLVSSGTAVAAAAAPPVRLLVPQLLLAALTSGSSLLYLKLFQQFCVMKRMANGWSFPSLALVADIIGGIASFVLHQIWWGLHAKGLL
ncbi:hypothetical protein F0562_011178 [Nyssa sinensis]|uniref:Uncharacterized protein n=1 Tax=Nyssa sinensis TaxID=561372 RepID=A0A5J5A0Y7_9ASTE|nr:hypothetical protein F0562_011178 [Nyssa sinensis]